MESREAKGMHMGWLVDAKRLESGKQESFSTYWRWRVHQHAEKFPVDDPSLFFLFFFS